MVGFPYPAVVRLVGGAAANWWEFDGTCALAGCDPLELPFNRFLAAVYAWFVRGITDPKEHVKFYEELISPLPGSNPDRVSDRVIEDELAAFGAAM